MTSAFFGTRRGHRLRPRGSGSALRLLSRCGSGVPKHFPPPPPTALSPDSGPEQSHIDVQSSEGLRQHAPCGRDAWPGQWEDTELCRMAANTAPRSDGRGLERPTVDFLVFMLRTPPGPTGVLRRALESDSRQGSGIRREGPRLQLTKGGASRCCLCCMHVMTSAEAIVPVWAAAARRQGGGAGLGPRLAGTRGGGGGLEGMDGIQFQGFPEPPGGFIKTKRGGGEGRGTDFLSEC